MASYHQMSLETEVLMTHESKTLANAHHRGQNERERGSAL